MQNKVECGEGDNQVCLDHNLYGEGSCCWFDSVIVNPTNQTEIQIAYM